MSLRVPYRLRRLFLLSWLVVIFTAIGFLFWYNEAVYSLPTPIPVAYNQIDIGSTISSENIAVANKPVLIHFFNPNCPCSRFNIKHFNSLVKQYGAQVDFRVVVLTDDKTINEQKIKSKYNLTVPVSFNASVAKECGVYSTPQAVIIDTDHKLFYRGNYNKSRYCTDANSNYAQQALDSLLTNHTDPAFSPFALKAYGCQLPNCNK